MEMELNVKEQFMLKLFCIAPNVMNFYAFEAFENIIHQRIVSLASFKSLIEKGFVKTNENSPNGNAENFYCLTEKGKIYELALVWEEVLTELYRPHHIAIPEKLLKFIQNKKNK